MKIDKKYYRMLYIVAAVVLLLIFAMVIMFLQGSGSKSYTLIENTMVSAAQKYYSSKPEELPKNAGETTSVDASKLISEGYMKDFIQYNKNASCTGKVYVSRLSNGYNYIGSLNCGKSYYTKFLVDKLLEKVVTEEDGLYEFSSVARPSGVKLALDEEGYDLETNPLLGGYIYRGRFVDNFIKLHDKLYRIIKIDKNRDLQIMYYKNDPGTSYYDSTYNSYTGDNSGFNDYKKSVMKVVLDNFYKSIPNDSLLKTKTVPKNICMGGVFNRTTSTDGNMECSKVMKNQYVSFIPVFDVLNASLSNECTEVSSMQCGSYNYITDSFSGAFTITPHLEENYLIYRIRGGGVTPLAASETSNLNYVMYLSNTVIYVSGDGTEEKPYIIK